MASTDSSLPEQLQLGEWTYRPELRLLRRNEDERQLKPLLDRLLRRLLREPGAVVSREQLIDEVWSRRMVNDEVLSRAIAELRAVLSDDAREPRYIQTLAKGGYRLIATVAPLQPAIETRALDEAEAVQPPATAAPTVSTPFCSPRSRPHSILLSALATLIVICLVLAVRAWWPAPQAELKVNLLTARALSADDRLELDPQFDPLGRIVYVRRGATGTASELLMVDRDGLAERVLWSTPGRLRMPQPSPDGSEIAVLHWPAERCEIWRVAVLDGQASRLAECSNTAHGGLQWLDDGEALLLTADPLDATRHAPGLARLDRRSGKITRLTEPSLAESAQVDPQLSADGRQLAYATLHSGERQLWLSDWPQMRERRALLARPEPVYSHAFDGNSLLVAGDLTLYRAVHRLRPGHTPELLGGRGASALDVAADGAVVWMQTSFDGEVWLRGVNDQEWRAIASSNRFESNPAFSPDGQQLALVSNRGDSEAIILVDRASGETTALRLDPRKRWVRPSYSTDGKSLLLTAYAGSRTALYRYHLDNGSVTPLSDDIEDAFGGIDVGDRLLYRRGTESEYRLEQRLHATAATSVIDIGPVATFRANSRWLVWRAPGQTQLRLAPLDTPQQSREIAKLDVTGEAFAVVDDALWFAFDGALWRQPLPDGEPQRQDTDRFPDVMRASIAVASDGTLAIARIETYSTELMLAVPMPP
ncbi:MAG: winged helix-turn-helix domain-containing protein [Pseudomarimonas sp.]